MNVVDRENAGYEPEGTDEMELEARLAAAESRIEQLTAALGELRRAGAVMGNICFNLSQEKVTISEHERQVMKQAQVAWDAAIDAARAVQEKP